MAEAGREARASLARTEAATDPESPETAGAPGDPGTCLAVHHLANLHHALGDYAAARKLFERNVSCFRSTNAPELAAALWSLADACDHLGDFDAAAAHLEEAIVAAETAPRQQALGSILNNAAVTYGNIGRHSDAERCYRRAMRLLETRGELEGTPRAARLMGSLAGNLVRQGRYAEGRELAEKAVAVLEGTVGRDAPTVASLLGIHAEALAGLGRKEDARRLYERSLAVCEKESSSGMSPDILETLVASGDFMMEEGALEQARRIFDRAAALPAAPLEPANPSRARALVRRAELRQRAGDLRGAFDDLSSGLEIRERSLGPDHPLTVEAILRRAGLRWGLGEPGAALADALRAEEAAVGHLRLTSAVLPERQALESSRVRPGGIALALSILTSRNAGEAETRDAWDAVIRSRTVVLDEMVRRQGRTIEPDGTEVEALWYELFEARRRLANLLVRGVDPESPSNTARALEAARTAVELAERLLVAKSPAFREEGDRIRIGLHDVAAALPDGAALVGYVRYERMHPPTGRAGPASPAGVASYLAFALPGPGASPFVVDLGPAAPIEVLVEQWRLAAGSEPSPYPAPARRDLNACRAAGERLRRAIWDPIGSRLGKARLALIVPDGALNLVSFAAMPSVNGTYLVEDRRLYHELSAERGVVRRPAPPDGGRSLLALGGPDFDALPASAPVPAATASLRVPEPPGASVPPDPNAPCDALGALRFAPLPGARAEVEEVGRLWSGTADGRAEPVRILAGAAATEESLKGLAHGHRMVHIATHAWFAGDSCLPDGPGRPPPMRRPADMRAMAAPPADNPLLRLAGLALSGANRRSLVDPNGSAEDGILTAEEIASIDLRGTEWVVLSGCETGVGSLQAGEGVLGLRRSFQIAGAGSLIMSLWRVRDDATRDWMRHLYANRLAGRTTAESVRRASVEVLAERREAGLSDHPFYWGAFVAAGDWR